MVPLSATFLATYFGGALTERPHIFFAFRPKILKKKNETQIFLERRLIYQNLRKVSIILDKRFNLHE